MKILPFPFVSAYLSIVVITRLVRVIHAIVQRRWIARTSRAMTTGQGMAGA